MSRDTNRVYETRILPKMGDPRSELDIAYLKITVFNVPNQPASGRLNIFAFSMYQTFKHIFPHPFTLYAFFFFHFFYCVYIFQLSTCGINLMKKNKWLSCIQVYTRFAYEHLYYCML